MSTISDIKARHPLEQVVQEHGVRLQGSGRLLRGRCPFHDDRTPSFFVNPETGRWRCFGRCDAANGRWLDVIDFAGWQLYNSAWNPRDKGMFKAALRALDGQPRSVRHTPSSTPGRQGTRRRGKKTVSELRPTPPLATETRMLLDRVAGLYRSRLWAIGAGPNTPLAYLHKRGFTGEIIQRAGLGYCAGDQVLKYLQQTGAPIELARALHLVDVQRGDCEFLRGRIVFPDFDATCTERGRSGGQAQHLVGRKWAKFLGKRSPKYLSMKGRGKPLFGWARLDKTAVEEPAFVTESLTDWLTLAQWGLDAVAVLGTALREDHAQALTALPRPLIYLPHNDENGAGIEAAEKWRQQVGRGEIQALPPRYAGSAIKDVNDLATMPGGREIFFQLLPT